MIEFTNKEALVIKNYLVIADIHLGIEKEYLLKGINIPSQTDLIIKKILNIKESWDAKNLIILGDVKHNVPNISYIEFKEVPYFFNKLKSHFSKIIVIKGNHDGNIEKLVEKSTKLKILKAFKLRKIVFTHGHLKPRIKGKLYIIGHHHFALRITSSINEVFYKKVYVYGECIDYDTLILPAFSDLAGYWEIKEFHGPIAKNIKKYYVISLDGYILQEGIV